MLSKKFLSLGAGFALGLMATTAMPAMALTPEEQATLEAAAQSGDFAQMEALTLKAANDARAEGRDPVQAVQESVDAAIANAANGADIAQAFVDAAADQVDSDPTSAATFAQAASSASAGLADTDPARALEIAQAAADIVSDEGIANANPALAAEIALNALAVASNEAVQEAVGEDAAILALTIQAIVENPALLEAVPDLAVAIETALAAVAGDELLETAAGGDEGLTDAGDDASPS